MAMSLRPSALRTLTLGLAAVASLSLAPKPASAEQFINVVTGGTSGVYYPLGVALTKLYVDAIPGVRTSVQATKASAEKTSTCCSVAAPSWRSPSAMPWPTPGTATRKPVSRKKLDKLRGVAAIYSNYVHIRRPCGFRHQVDRRPQGQAGVGRCAEVGHRTQRPCAAQCQWHPVFGFLQGGISAVRRIRAADPEQTRSTPRCCRLASASRRSANSPPAPMW